MARKAVIVAGLRTPFLKSGQAFQGLKARHLGAAVVAKLLTQVNLNPKEIDRVIYGQVVADVVAPNIAREIVLATGLPATCDAYSVSRACATGTQSIIEGAMAILSGDIDVAICGGADSLSNPPITYRDKVVAALMKANSARDIGGKLKAFKGVGFKDLLPQPPALTELSTQLTMGESAEVMAKANHIMRREQDEFAAESHRKSAKAWEEGIYGQEVMTYPVPPTYKEVISKDGLVRKETTLEKLEKLKPVFDKKHGTITAGSSSPLTDGASALLVMEEEKAKSLGFPILAEIKAWAFAAVDPKWQLLQAPAIAAPQALKKAGLALKEMDYIDMHEAFAAQVLSNIQALGSFAFAEHYLGRSEAVGEVDFAKLNVFGGSISLGHPFAATGARQALTMARALHRRGGGHALITQCAAGALGAALVLESKGGN